MSTAIVSRLTEAKVTFVGCGKSVARHIAVLIAVPILGGSAIGAESAAPIPDFSGTWTHPAFPWFEPPASGPGPITNLSRWAEQRPAGEGGSAALPPSTVGISNNDQLVGDYKSPILQPWAAEVVKRFGQMAIEGTGFPTPSDQCWPYPVPFIY